MSEQRLAERLAKYRPVSPPVDLRARLSRTTTGRTPWAAIAALLFFTVAVRTFASAQYMMTSYELSSAPRREALVQAFAEQLGGDSVAYETARVLIAHSDARRFQ